MGQPLCAIVQNKGRRTLGGCTSLFSLSHCVFHDFMDGGNPRRSSLTVPHAPNPFAFRSENSCGDV